MCKKSLLSAFLLVALGLNAQTVILDENFSSITSGESTSSMGATSPWTGNSNFPTISSVYKAGGAIKLGTSSKTGLITSKPLDLSVNGGYFKVSFDVKGWTTVEGDILVKVTAIDTKTVTYSAVMKSALFENKLLEFKGGTSNSTITIETTSKRAYIDNVKVFYDELYCKSTNLAFSVSDIDKIIGDADYFLRATSLNINTPVIYSSSNEDICVVDSLSGEVIIKNAGTDTIVATQVAGMQDSVSFCAASTSYVLTVHDVPKLVVSEVYAIDMIAENGISDERTILVEGRNLSDDIYLEINGIDAGLFSVSQPFLSQSGGSVEGIYVTVTYSPGYAGSHSAYLKMKSKNTPDVDVLLKGSGISTGLIKDKKDFPVMAENGTICFYSEAGVPVDVYNIIGQKIESTFAIDGLNSITTSLKGLVFLRVGNHKVKLIL